MKSFNRWIRSKQGLMTIVGTLIVAVVVIGAGQLAGWWDIVGALTGAAGIPSPEYPNPVGGSTCLPTCSETDGKFFILPGEGTNSFTAWPVVVWIGVPGNSTSFTLGIFDGDTGKDNTGAINWQGGNWENGTDELVYTLYADPLANGEGMTVVNTWYGNQDNMPNNAWFDATVATADAAKAPSGHYYYRLEATRPAGGPGSAVFKLRSSGYLRAGNNTKLDAAFGITAAMNNMSDFAILHPQNQGINNPGPSNYTGDWALYFEVPATQKEITIWDGDFDRGTTEVKDTDDPDTPNEVPGWVNNAAAVVAEREGGAGIPPENSTNPFYLRGGPVFYEIITSQGQTYGNSEPSGTEEWEMFTLTAVESQGGVFNRATADLSVPSLPAGLYVLHISGLDISNHVWLRTNFYICDPEDGCGPPLWEGGGCALPVSYWRSNFAKVYKNEGKKAQEDKVSLEWALRNTALGSPIFRSGITVTAPTVIASPTPLPPLTALEILQGKNNTNKPMARALKHLLSAWLNLGAGKLRPDTPAYLNVTGGYFEGTVWEALKEAESLILNGGDLKRAAEIAEFITYGGTFEEPPKAVPPAAPAPVAPPLPPDPAACGARINIYNVENPTNNPFYGVKFEFASGTEVKNGLYDEFRIVLPADVAAGITSVQMEAKAAGDVGQVTLTSCNFASPLACGEPVKDENNYFAFYFMGAIDNGDGTMTLIFNVQNFTAHGLSHATIGLPAGVTPASPTGSYEAKVCPTP